MTQPSEPTGWRVTQQTPGMGRVNNGPYVQGVNVSYMMENGISGTVFVPNDQYRPEIVREMIGTSAQNMMAVHRLTGSA